MKFDNKDRLLIHNKKAHSGRVKIVPILIQKGYYPHPYLGLVFATLTSDLAQDNDIPGGHSNKASLL